VYFVGTLYDLTILEDIFREIKKRSLSIVVAGIPSTADDEFPIVDFTIGFDTVIEVYFKHYINCCKYITKWKNKKGSLKINSSCIYRVKTL